MMRIVGLYFFYVLVEVKIKTGIMKSKRPVGAVI